MASYRLSMIAPSQAALEAAKRRQIVAHGTSHGNNAQEEGRAPAGAAEIMDYSFAEDVLSPLPGLPQQLRARLFPTALAMGHILPALPGLSPHRRDKATAPSLHPYNIASMRIFQLTSQVAGIH
ncbi:MAG: hypothetical protein P4N24_21740 [Acidobacteriota bacterium]|nr:hypothetical protein [Acidobacteriota bacterium]